MGIDPSSTKIGIAIVSDGKLEHFETIIPDKKLPLESQLGAVTKQVAALVRVWRPQRAAVEQVSVTFNMNSVRKIAYFEAACMMGCAAKLVDVVSMKTTSARKHGLGNGGLKKPEAVKLVRARFGDEINDDEADAIVLALAAAVV